MKKQLVALFAVVMIMMSSLISKAYAWDVDRNGIIVFAFTGDSNTIRHYDGTSWGEVFQSLMEDGKKPEESLIYAVYASPAGHAPHWPDGYDFLEQAFSNALFPDNVVIAVGEIDVAIIALYGCPPSQEEIPQEPYQNCLREVVNVLREQYDIARSYRAKVYVATILPIFEPTLSQWSQRYNYNVLAEEFNAMLIEEFGKKHIMDRYTGLGPEHFYVDLGDGVHLNASGHKLLACRLYKKVTHRTHDLCR